MIILLLAVTEMVCVIFIKLFLINVKSSLSALLSRQFFASSPGKDQLDLVILKTRRLKRKSIGKPYSSGDPRRRSMSIVTILFPLVNQLLVFKIL